MGQKTYMLVTEGIGVGDAVAWGSDIDVKNGNTLPLENIPAGSVVCNIESRPNDGGKFVRSTGVQAVVLTRLKGKWASECLVGRRSGSMHSVVQQLV